MSASFDKEYRNDSCHEKFFDRFAKHRVIARFLQISLDTLLLDFLS